MRGRDPPWVLVGEANNREAAVRHAGANLERVLEGDELGEVSLNARRRPAGASSRHDRWPPSSRRTRWFRSTRRGSTLSFFERSPLDVRSGRVAVCWVDSSARHLSTSSCGIVPAKASRTSSRSCLWSSQESPCRLRFAACTPTTDNFEERRSNISRAFSRPRFATPSGRTSCGRAHGVRPSCVTPSWRSPSGLRLPPLRRANRRRTFSALWLRRLLAGRHVTIPVYPATW